MNESNLKIKVYNISCDKERDQIFFLKKNFRDYLFSIFNLKVPDENGKGLILSKELIKDCLIRNSNGEVYEKINQKSPKHQSIHNSFPNFSEK